MIKSAVIILAVIASPFIVQKVLYPPPPVGCFYGSIWEWDQENHRDRLSGTVIDPVKRASGLLCHVKYTPEKVEWTWGLEGPKGIINNGYTVDDEL